MSREKREILDCTDIQDSWVDRVNPVSLVTMAILDSEDVMENLAYPDEMVFMEETLSTISIPCGL